MLPLKDLNPIRTAPVVNHVKRCSVVSARCSDASGTEHRAPKGYFAAKN